MIEGGGEVIWSAFEAGLVDEFSVYVGPLVIGGSSSPTPADGLGVRDLTKAAHLEIVEIERGRAYTAINRRNGRRVVQVEANVSPRSRTVEIMNVLAQDELPWLADRYPGLSYSFEGRQAESRKSLGSLKIGFIIALLIIYGMLAIPLRSYLQPLIVMTSIPFGIIGAVVGHLIMGYSLSLMSLFGIVALSGVVINDALVLVDYANRRIRYGRLSAHDAVVEAGTQRFRPILLTTLTTFCGLSPMIFESSRQARFLIPIAISLGFGILFATVITLILVPSIYMISDDIRRVIFRSGSEVK